MDRLTYDEAIAPGEILELSLRQSADLCARWHGRDRGRLRYAFTPRFAVSCSPDLLSESARLAAETGAYWQTHLSEDGGEMGEVQRLFPDARDYLDVYDLAGGLGARTILATPVISRRVRSRGWRRAARTLPTAPPRTSSWGAATCHWRSTSTRGSASGWARTSPRGPSCRSSADGAGATTAACCVPSTIGCNRWTDWLAAAALGTARRAELQVEIGSVEVGKEADLILVDPELTAPLRGIEATEPSELMGRLIFRPHPDVVRGAWVRGRRLAADQAV